MATQGMTVDSEQVERLISWLLVNVQNPKPLLRKVEKYVGAVTKQMFAGRRPDIREQRGQLWERLSPNTIKQKAALRARGAAIAIHRPLVRTGKARDSLRVLRRSERGFVYGTDVRNEKGFPYMTAHQTGTPTIPQRLSIFLTKHDLRQIVKMTIDHLRPKAVREWNEHVES